MKLITLTHKNAKKFPFVDCDYQAASLKNLSGCCGRISSKSLRDISCDYFDSEAKYDFLSNAAIFGALMAVAAEPIIAGASAVIELCRTLPLF